jgi:hypothetical protein
MDTKIILDVETGTIEKFKSAAERAKAIGFTHVMVGHLPRSRWMWEADTGDPYPNWCMGHAQLFKLVCPPQLEKYLPVPFISQCFNLVKARCDVLGALGMKGALFSNEPFWLPEAVYRDHPAWRGARCDHPRRSKHPYYSPCIDNPDVLAMYRNAVRELVSRTGIDFISFMSNDSGGGLCWSNGTYVGPNGPEACRNRSMSGRINGFLDALSAGGKDGGTDLTLGFNANIGFKLAEAGVAEAWRAAKDNYIINGRDNKGEYPLFLQKGEREWIRGIPNIFGLAQTWGAAIKSGKRIVTIQLIKTDFGENWKYIEDNIRNMPSTLKGCMDGVYRTAKQIAGEESADLLNDAFYHISEGELHFSHDGLGLIMYGVVHQRWINRPFVLFPEELTDEERSYYRRFQFQALGEEHANDLLDMQNIECARGFSAAFLLSETARKATASFNRAIALLEELAAGEKKPDLKEKAALLVRRLKVYNCLMKTCANAALFQDLVDNIDFNAEPPLDCRWPTRNDPRIEQYQNITRSEIDNAYTLADLLEGWEDRIFHVTGEENEDVFVFGPNLVSQIRKKAEIMLNHQLDGNRVFERHNI